ncbi:hypothetical protein I8J29_15545 [Paenibacillus sp. MWE-103]|uniref:Colicin import membrane protein n=1 Tax=Paenibacillus artemisiicola TaxID=1172618 RepID=A0ABS3WBD8_9BACL|nr:hypothetical protein [Paenibacillus artemisiicola]MBO7745624.1 hypothetical protein [Paenibacillus artemisiicola]
MLNAMRMNAFSSILLALLAFALLIPGSASAASVSISKTAETALTKHIAAAPAATKDKLNAQYLALQSYQRQETSLDERYKSLHASNGQLLDAANKRIKAIDAEKLARLANEANAAREKYKPLFDLYTSLNKRIADARKLKLKELTAVLSRQAETVKVAVQLARAEIRMRDDALKAAKASTAKTVKALKTKLAAIDPLRDQTKVAQSAVSGMKKNIPGVVKTMNACVKSGSFAGTLEALNALVSSSKGIADQKSRIVGYENGITAVINGVNAQIPAK